MSCGFGVDQFRLLVGKRHFRAAHVQIANDAGGKPVLLGLHFLLKHSDRLFAHPDLGAVQEQLVKSDAHVHCHAVGSGLQFQFLVFEVQSRDGELAGDRAAGVEALHHPHRGVVIFLPQP